MAAGQASVAAAGLCTGGRALPGLWGHLGTFAQTEEWEPLSWMVQGSPAPKTTKPSAVRRTVLCRRSTQCHRRKDKHVLGGTKGRKPSPQVTSVQGGPYRGPRLAPVCADRSLGVHSRQRHPGRPPLCLMLRSPRIHHGTSGLMRTVPGASHVLRTGALWGRSSPLAGPFRMWRTLRRAIQRLWWLPASAVWPPTSRRLTKPGVSRVLTDSEIHTLHTFPVS